MKKYIKYLLYIIGSLLISSFIITFLQYFNLLSDKFVLILLYLFPLLVFVIFPNKYSNRNKKNTIKLSFSLVSLFFLISLFKNGFELKNLIYFLLITVFSLFPSFIKKKADD